VLAFYRLNTNHIPGAGKQMAAQTHYKAVIIGAGQAGKPLAVELAKAGWPTALIERQHVGGTCVNEGCSPTKTMIASARVAHLVRRAPDYGIHPGKVLTVDMRRVWERKQQIVDSFRQSGEKQIEQTEGLDFLMGEARFVDAKTLDVKLNEGGSQRITADYIFINAGARPSKPPIPGIDRVPTLNSTSIMELDHVPEHLMILGGSYIALEFGQMFRRFGSRVTIIERAERLISREDPDVSEAMTNILREDGIDVLVGTEISKVEPVENGQIGVTVKTADGERVLTGSHLLVATGRAPNTNALNPQAAGIELDDKGHIKTDEKLETNVPGIYALGDVKGGPAFTHVSYDDYRIIRDNLLQGGSRSVNDRLLTYTVFTDPQLGRVGLNETEAREKGHNIRVAKLPMSRVARAQEVDETRGFMKAIVDADTEQILGAVVLGIEGGEVVTVLQVAMMGKLPYTVIKDGVFSHPTLAESLNNLFMTLE
jgi:pyruvate/2-oxoglutarate dehydrogenase complex dihydrolipoamide dehydrogenase (E3) component